MIKNIPSFETWAFFYNYELQNLYVLYYNFMTGNYDNDMILSKQDFFYFVYKSSSKNLV